jgi:hypothetical protein
MHVQTSTVLVIAAVISSVLLVMNRGDKLFPVIAVVAAGIMALMVFGVMSLSLKAFRVDVILPAVLVVAGALCWGRSSSKSDTTAATVLVAAATLMLALALNVTG